MAMPQAPWCSATCCYARRCHRSTLRHRRRYSSGGALCFLWARDDDDNRIYDGVKHLVMPVCVTPSSPAFSWVQKKPGLHVLRRDEEHRSQVNRSGSGLTAPQWHANLMGLAVLRCCHKYMFPRDPRSRDKCGGDASTVGHRNTLLGGGATRTCCPDSDIVRTPPAMRNDLSSNGVQHTEREAGLRQHGNAGQLPRSPLVFFITGHWTLMPLRDFVARCQELSVVPWPDGVLFASKTPPAGGQPDRGYCRSVLADPSLRGNCVGLT
jgi:hypothetical protein